MAQKNNTSSGWVGWVYFAGILLLIQAFFQALIGFVSFTRSDLFVVAENNALFFDFTAWGWVHLILAIVLLTAGFSVINGGLWGRTIGVIFGIISFFINIAFLPAYPVWLTIAAVLDLIIIYALIVHGREARL